MKPIDLLVKKGSAKKEQKSSLESHLDDRSWIKNRIRFNMQLVEDFQQVKEDRDLDKREKAYYNEQIEEAQEKVRVLTKLAQEMAEGVDQ